MSNATPFLSRSPLEQWIYQTIARRGMRVKFRLRGNKLHLLIEQQNCPDRTETLLWLIPALQETNLSSLLPEDQPIYQLQLYACELGQRQPAWTASIYLNQLDRHLHQLAVGEEVPEVTGPAAAPAPPTNFAPQRIVSAPSKDTATLALSNLSLAKRGEEMAIASYLSETLSHWGVGVRVSAKSVSYLPPTAVYSTDTPIQDTWMSKRLWVACEAAYSLDPASLGEPVTQKLRELEIEGYRDAIVLFQVQGETEPDWLLRVDLTPATEMLREWARWGDVEAIQRLLNRDLASWGLEITKATLTDITLHLCTDWKTVEPAQAETENSEAIEQRGETGSPQTLPELEQKRLKAEVALALEALGPQGIHAATLYGPETAPDSPGWVEWMPLPASVHAAFADAPLTLAQRGDWEAVAFLLHRLLNPNLDHYLTIGGIRLLLLPKADPNAKGQPGDEGKVLLHLMCEAALCPDPRQVSPAITKFLQQLKLPNLSGVRIYGRRAGQKKPLWSNGVDFLPRHRLVPEVVPEFAVTSACVDELIPPSEESVLRPDLTPADLQTTWREFRQQCGYQLRQLLTRSQIFVPAAAEQPQRAALPGQVSYQGTAVGLVWSAIGLLLMVQGNWLLLSWLRNQPAPAEAENRSTLIAPTEPATSDEQLPVPPIAASPSPISPSSKPQGSPQIRLKQAPNTSPDTFNREGFTRSEPQANPQNAQTDRSPAATPATSGQNPAPRQNAASGQSSAGRNSAVNAVPLPYTPVNDRLNQASFAVQAQAANLPTFNSRQLDQKLQLYYNFLREQGTPDILIVGSSRALRGVDPIALQQELAKAGYPNLKIFNLGINGATAQVVDLLVQQILTPEQLPRLIIWADGARAFNSGTTDITYNGIVASSAHRQLLAGTFPIPNAPGVTAALPAEDSGFNFSLNTSLTESYQQLDRWFSSQLAQAAPVHQGRDRLKYLIQQQLTAFMPDGSDQSVEAINLQSSPGQDASTLQPGQPIMDLQGFLSLGMQFNPATYYQKYARVVGQYDSDYENFRIQGEQEDALKSLLEFTKARQIPVVFINLPLTRDYLDPARMRHERSFRQYMVEQRMSNSGLIFLDLGEKWTSELRYFSDPSHLNRYGAFAVAEKIAQDALIPWSVATSR
jgi:hypothetical protein